jgi:mono/diheme cytochrome c family protein
MLSGRMPSCARSRFTALVTAAFAALAIAACGEEGIQLSEDDPNYAGAELFSQNCSGCHTLSVAGTQGSAEDANGREYVDGPNFDQRIVERDQVLYAIANGGFSSGPMPQDILVGEDAEKVADFLAEYSGSDVDQNAPEPASPPPTGADEDDGGGSSPGD